MEDEVTQSARAGVRGGDGEHRHFRVDRKAVLAGAGLSEGGLERDGGREDVPRHGEGCSARIGGSGRRGCLSDSLPTVRAVSCIYLTVVGGGLEVVGVGFATAEIMRVQRAELGIAPLPVRVWFRGRALLRRLLRRPHQVVSLSAESAGKATMTADVRVITSLPPDAPIGDRVGLLEEQLRTLRDEVDRDRQAAIVRADEVRQHGDKAVTEIREQLDRRDTARRDQVRSVLRLQTVAVFFSAGVVLSLAGNVVPC